MDDQLNSFYWLDLDTQKVFQLLDYGTDFDFAETAYDFFVWSQNKNYQRIEDYTAYKAERFKNN